VKDSGDIITIDVKGIAGTTLWPTDNLTTFTANHFIVFASFLGKINDHRVLPEIYIVPSERLVDFIYHNPNQTRQGVRLATMRRDGNEFKDAWYRLEG
jgi:hypothetical protein